MRRRSEAPMWNIAICYCSRHHGNTRKVLEAMTGQGEAALIDVTACGEVCLEDYDCIGVASGIYFGRFHRAVAEAARRHLPHGRPVFFVCTYGGGAGKALCEMEALARERDCQVLGSFGCKGYDTFGPFKLVGGIARGRPNETDLADARQFYRAILARNIERNRGTVLCPAEPRREEHP